MFFNFSCSTPLIELNKLWQVQLSWHTYIRFLGTKPKKKYRNMKLTFPWFVQINLQGINAYFLFLGLQRVTGFRRRMIHIGNSKFQLKGIYLQKKKTRNKHFSFSYFSITQANSKNALKLPLFSRHNFIIRSLIAEQQCFHSNMLLFGVLKNCY